MDDDAFVGLGTTCWSSGAYPVLIYQGTKDIYTHSNLRLDRLRQMKVEVLHTDTNVNHWLI